MQSSTVSLTPGCKECPVKVSECSSGKVPPTHILSMGQLKDRSQGTRIPHWSTQISHRSQRTPNPLCPTHMRLRIPLLPRKCLAGNGERATGSITRVSMMIPSQRYMTTNIGGITSFTMGKRSGVRHSHLWHFSQRKRSPKSA